MIDGTIMSCLEFQFLPTLLCGTESSWKKPRNSVVTRRMRQSKFENAVTTHIIKANNSMCDTLLRHLAFTERLV